MWLLQLSRQEAVSERRLSQIVVAVRWFMLSGGPKWPANDLKLPFETRLQNAALKLRSRGNRFIRLQGQAFSAWPEVLKTPQRWTARLLKSSLIRR